MPSYHPSRCKHRVNQLQTIRMAHMEEKHFVQNPQFFQTYAVTTYNRLT